MAASSSAHREAGPRHKVQPGWTLLSHIQLLQQKKEGKKKKEKKKKKKTTRYKLARFKRRGSYPQRALSLRVHAYTQQIIDTIVNNGEVFYNKHLCTYTQARYRDYSLKGDKMLSPLTKSTCTSHAFPHALAPFSKYLTLSCEYKEKLRSLQ